MRYTTFANGGRLALEDLNQIQDNYEAGLSTWTPLLERPAFILDTDWSSWSGQAVLLGSMAASSGGFIINGYVARAGFFLRRPALTTGQRRRAELRAVMTYVTAPNVTWPDDVQISVNLHRPEFTVSGTTLLIVPSGSAALASAAADRIVTGQVITVTGPAVPWPEDGFYALWCRSTVEKPPSALQVFGSLEYRVV
ncbi:MAG TPA: hypothetical protein VN238_18360 [Solirubrobacteraceae bacterium]|nr:hypothetical protein [Solirubrobacteraceae bacterium]